MEEYNKQLFGSYLVKGQLHQAVNYLSRFPDYIDLYEKYIRFFQEGQYYKRTDNKILGSIDQIYQNYYRNVFWTNISNEEAKELLFKELWNFCGSKSSLPIDENIEDEIKRIVNLEGYQYLGSDTGPYYGPYIWRDSEEITYEVELPSGMELYTIIMMDGFISRSWLDFISFGNTGTGGWIGKDGKLYCVKSVYDTEGDAFNISYLKHEAQHAYDEKNYPNMGSYDLEYRAKLVELIYWANNERIIQFYREADNSNPDNSHSMASYRIINEMSQEILGYEYTNDENILGNELDKVKKYAMELFNESNSMWESRKRDL